MTERGRRLRAWFASPSASWLHVEWSSVVEETRVIYDEENLDEPERFAVVERQALDDYQVIVSTYEDEQAASERVAYLLQDAQDSSWHPVHVIDLDDGQDLSIRVSVRLERVVPA